MKEEERDSCDPENERVRKLQKNIGEKARGCSQKVQGSLKAGLTNEPGISPSPRLWESAGIFGLTGENLYVRECLDLVEFSRRVEKGARSEQSSPRANMAKY